MASCVLVSAMGPFRLFYCLYWVRAAALAVRFFLIQCLALGGHSLTHVTAPIGWLYLCGCLYLMVSLSTHA